MIFTIKKIRFNILEFAIILRQSCNNIKFWQKAKILCHKSYFLQKSVFVKVVITLTKLQNKIIKQKYEKKLWICQKVLAGKICNFKWKSRDFAKFDLLWQKLAYFCYILSANFTWKSCHFAKVVISMIDKLENK